MDHAAQVNHLKEQIDGLPLEARNQTWAAIWGANEALISAGGHGQLALAFLNTRQARLVFEKIEDLQTKLARTTWDYTRLYNTITQEREDHKADLKRAKKKAKK